MNRVLLTTKVSAREHLSKESDPDQLNDRLGEVPDHIGQQGPDQSACLVDSLQHAALQTPPTMLVFSHLRWHFVTQRPQHLLTLAAQSRSIYFWEEPFLHPKGKASYPTPPGGTLELISGGTPNVIVVRPHFNEGEDPIEGQQRLLNAFVAEHDLRRYDRWYYTPMALDFTSHLRPEVTIYDCMDELSAFLGAPTALVEREKELFRVADVVFAGGQSIYEAKRHRHPNVYPFPSSIDVPHFAQAHLEQPDPEDQKVIPCPRVGFFGVVDERFDLKLLTDIAHMRPQIHFVIIGPVVKIDLSSLPQKHNIHYLGMKSYDELPAYLANWNAAILPFAMNESTRFISPTKTLEYLASGKRVVSTPVRDVVTGYGTTGLVDIAETSFEFAASLDRALHSNPNPEWTVKVARKLADSSWASTWSAMDSKIEAVRSRSTTVLPSTVFHSRRATASEDERFDYVVVGAGFAGAVVAERLASQLHKRVLVIDKRPHIAGNAYDFYNEYGILIHQYGPHIFHTSSQKVIAYLSNFTHWRSYEHRVLAQVDGKLLPIPINLDTINRLYCLNLDIAQMKTFLEERIEERAEIRTSEDIVVSRIGRDLYEKFFRNYTRKQWGLDPSQLDSSVAGRIPVRFNQDDRYFTDSFQAMPLEGYTRMFERMLSHPNISVMLSTDYRGIVGRYRDAEIVYTGPIDEFFDYRYGPLPYRSLRFEHRTHDWARFQEAPVINYPNDHAYTRITEFKYLTGQQHDKTSIVYEYPCDEGEPYYPIPRPENTELYERYRALAAATTGVHFCGRLANYRYFNMDQVVAQALHLYRNIADAESTVTRPVRTVSVGAASFVAADIAL